MRLANGVGLAAVLWITKEWDMAVIVTDGIDDSGEWYIGFGYEGWDGGREYRL